MGLYTLSEFREEIQLSTGNTGLENSRLTRYVNFAYYELTGSINFENLNALSDFVTIVGEGEYDIPANVALVKAVLNRSDLSDALLGYRDPVEYYRTNRSVNGTPRIWSRRGDNLLIAPYPSAVVNMTMLVRNEPSALTADSDVTELDNTWDPGISLLATHYAKMSLGHQDAAAFYNRAVQYLASRVVDEEMVLRESSLGQAIGRVIQGGGG